jgi:hypothetical protein
MYLARPEEGASDERILTRGKANYAKSAATRRRPSLLRGRRSARPGGREDGDSILWAAMRDALSPWSIASGARHSRSTPKGHARFIYGPWRRR